MNDLSTDTVGEFNPIPCTEIVYRALRSKKCVDEDTGEVSPEAYYLRIDKDGNREEGLSVCIGTKCNPEDCGGNLKRRFGVVSLHVGYVRSLGLDVVSDPPPEYHALIVNVPYREDDPVRAERIAGLLAKHSRFQWSP
jgi:hypothetical protein